MKFYKLSKQTICRTNGRVCQGGGKVQRRQGLIETGLLIGRTNEDQSERYLLTVVCKKRWTDD